MEPVTTYKVTLKYKRLASHRYYPILAKAYLFDEVLGAFTHRPVWKMLFDEPQGGSPRKRISVLLDNIERELRRHHNNNEFKRLLPSAFKVEFE